jgi:hypothetical protein
VQELDRVLTLFDPTLPARVRRVADYLHRGGMSVDAAVERALSLSLADASIEKFQKIGRLQQQGRLIPVGGFGAVTGSADAGDVAAQMLQNIACAPDVAASTTTLVGQKEGADAAMATQIGFAVTRSMAQCTPGALPAPPPPPASSDEGSMLVPILLSVSALAVVGGAVWFATRKK